MKTQREIAISNPEQLVGFSLEKISYSSSYVDFMFVNEGAYQQGAVARFFGMQSISLDRGNQDLSTDDGKLRSFGLIGREVQAVSIDDKCLSIYFSAREVIVCEYRLAQNPRDAFLFFPEVSLLPSAYFVPIGDVFDFDDVPLDANLYIPIDDVS